MPTPAAAHPHVTFSTFLVSIASTALQHLGEVHEGHPKPAEPDLALARQTLELVDLFAAKTRGNLDEDESRLLEAVRGELSEKIAAAAR